MDNQLLQLRDIAGFDAISNWPPAPIWWMISALIIVVIIVLSWRVYKKLSYRLSWQYDAARELIKLEKNLNKANAHESLLTLSELIKRIIMQKYSREDCANLSGEKLLLWMSQRDPQNFDWKSEGKILTNIVYAPANKAVDYKQVKILIHAIKRWVDRNSLKTKKYIIEGR